MVEKQPLTRRQLNQLFADLHQSRVEKRKQGNQQLSYLAAYDVKATLIRIFGFGGFSADLIESEIMDVREVKQSKGDGINHKVTARAVVRLYIHQLGATYTEAAIAGSSQPDITESMDMALKSAESDALKRAAIYLGTQFGLSLYDNGSLRDIVKVTMSPDQPWPEPTREQAEQEMENLRRIIDGLPPQRGPQQEPVRQYDGPSEGVTPEQHQENLGLVDRALNMKRERDGKATGPAEAPAE